MDMHSYHYSFYNCNPMTAMSSFSHHHHHHHHPPPPPPSNGPLSVSPSLSGLSSSNATSTGLANNNGSQQCLQQGGAQQQHLTRDIISPSPYQCHMSVRHSPCSPSQGGLSSVYQMNGGSPAAYGAPNTPNGTTGKQRLSEHSRKHNTHSSSLRFSNLIPQFHSNRSHIAWSVCSSAGCSS